VGWSGHNFAFLSEGSALTGLWAGAARNLDLTPDRTNGLYLHHVQTGHMVHPPAYSIGNEVFFPEVKRAVFVANHLHLASRLRKLGAISTLSRLPA